MPCRYDDFGKTEGSYVNDKELDLLWDYEAAFCAVMTALESEPTGGWKNKVIDTIDWKESGLTKKRFNEIWKIHKAKDEKRKAQERIEQLREATEKKLKETMEAHYTPEELAMIKKMIQEGTLK